MFDYQEYLVRASSKDIELERDQSLLFHPTCPFCHDSHSTWTMVDSILTCGSCGKESTLVMKNDVHQKSEVSIVGLQSKADLKMQQNLTFAELEDKISHSEDGWKRDLREAL